MTRQEVLKIIEETCEKLNAPISKYITIKYSNRMYRAQGVCRTYTGMKSDIPGANYLRGTKLLATRFEIKLSNKWLNHPEFSDSEIKELIVHEVCHAVDSYQGYNSGHGSNWQRLMVRCGYSPDRYYQGELRVNSVNFTCTKCEHRHSVSKRIFTGRMKKLGCIGRCKCGNRLTKEVMKDAEFSG